MPPPDDRCENCKWWTAVNGWGQCHRHAPVPVVQCQGETHHEHNEACVVYPHTPTYEWCGDFAKKV